MSLLIDEEQDLKVQFLDRIGMVEHVHPFTEADGTRSVWLQSVISIRPEEWRKITLEELKEVLLEKFSRALAKTTILLKEKMTEITS